MASESDVRRFFAETGRQSTLDRVGIAEATRMFESGQLTDTRAGAGVSGVSRDPINLAKQMFELSAQFRKPAVETLEAGRAGIAPAYGGLRGAAEATRPTIEQRYRDTLQEITKTTREAAAGEFTRRGIPLSSGLVEQTVGSRLAPQIAQAATQRDVSQLGITQLLADIGMGEQTAQSALSQAIAAVQAGASPEAITSAMNIYQQQEQARQAELTRGLQQQQLGLQERQFGAEEARAVSRDPFEIALLEAQAANQRRLAAGGASGGAFTPTTATGVQASFGAGPGYSPAGGEGSWDQQPDGTIWEFSGGQWVQRG